MVSMMTEGWAQPVGESEPACLLQSTSQFSSGDLSLDAEAENHSAISPRSAILFEAEALEDSTMKHLMVRSRARSRSCKAHLTLLRRKTNGLERSNNESSTKLDKLVGDFISKQSGSQDVCTSQLMEAKHQLNQVHEYVMDLVVQVNTTERAILALDDEMQNKVEEIEELDKWKEEELAKCEKKKQADIEMYKKLSVEMKEMKQIASPSVAMNVATGTLDTVGKAVGLVQMNSDHNHTKDMHQLKLNIKDTQVAAKRLMQCMAQKPRSLVQRVEENFEIRDVSSQKLQDFKLSKQNQSCRQTYGGNWMAASVAEVANWCGCDMKQKDKKNWCLCPKKVGKATKQDGQVADRRIEGRASHGKRIQVLCEVFSQER